jgi:hypothetical protein
MLLRTELPSNEDDMTERCPACLFYWGRTCMECPKCAVEPYAVCEHCDEQIRWVPGLA